MATNQTFYIEFFAPVVPESVAALMQVVDNKLKQGAKKLGLLISSPGGDVFQGLSAYNFLKGIPLRLQLITLAVPIQLGLCSSVLVPKDYRYPMPVFFFMVCNVIFISQSV